MFMCYEPTDSPSVFMGKQQLVKPQPRLKLLHPAFDPQELNGEGSSSVSRSDADSSALTSGLANANPTFDPVLACPSTLSDLTDGVRSYGGMVAVSHNPSQQLVGTRVSRKSAVVKSDRY